ncbi:MAG: hypothetical protein ACJAZ9_001651 [Neolewinella sp.]|jgi:hypothetical protein
MHFSLHSLGPEYESNLVYFRLHAAETEVVSPIYPDPTTALENIKTFLLTLRKENSGGYVEKDENGSYFLYFFGKKKPAVGEFPTFSGQSTPLSIIDHCREAARATTFKVDFMGLKDELEDVTTLKDLDLTKTDSHYNW